MWSLTHSACGGMWGSAKLDTFVNNIQQGWATLMIERAIKMLSSLIEGQIVIAHFHQ